MVGDVASLPDGTGSLTVLTNERGGVIDDCVVTKVGATTHSSGPHSVALLPARPRLSFQR